MKKIAELKILVADDHALMRRGIRDSHDQDSWKVVGEAASGREAVDQAKKLKPDVAIVDVTMPELDGLETTRLLRQEVPDIKVLILTMHESTRMVRRVFEAGADGYVLKSDFPRSLVNGVKAVSQGKRFYSPNLAEIVVKAFLEEPQAPPEVPMAGFDERTPTARELQIIRLLAAGKANKEIAQELELSVRTVETHRAKIMLKLGLKALPGLVRYAVRNGLIES